MTIVHVLNYTIPIAFMVFFGYWLDRMCKPGKETSFTQEMEPVAPDNQIADLPAK